jgi:glyoxylase-like metal-dependent hydrolase (beta-lactamase superfamily II)
MINVKIFPFNPLQENTYILYNQNNQCVIIDPGCYSEAEREKIKDFIAEKGLKPVLLVNTHCHLDHVFGNKFIADTYKLELFIHPGEKLVLDHAPTSGLMWNLPFDNYTGNIHDLVPGEYINLGDEQLQILFTPGHSPASVSFYSQSNGFLLAGDVLFRDSVGRTDLPGGSPDILMKSIKDQFYILPDETIVYSGHGMPTTIGHEKKHNPYVNG